MSSNLPVEEKLDPRVKRTRNLLGDAFISTLAEKGFQSISVQDITGKAGVNRTTFYLHFPDKYALLDYSINERFRQEIEERMLNACHFSEENLRALIVMVSEFIALSNSHCAASDPQFESLVETQVKKQVHDLILVWVDKADPGNDHKNTATAASWAIYGLALQWSHEKKHSSADKFADEALPLIIPILGLMQPA